MLWQVMLGGKERKVRFPDYIPSGIPFLASIDGQEFTLLYAAEQGCFWMDEGKGFQRAFNLRTQQALVAGEDGVGQVHLQLAPSCGEPRTLSAEVQVHTPGIAKGSGGAAGGMQSIKAPLAGKVLQVDVAEGDQVTAGQRLCTIEAMKMENPIAAGAAGTVKKVKIEPGQQVAVGAVLFQVQR